MHPLHTHVDPRGDAMLQLQLDVAARWRVSPVDVVTGSFGLLAGPSEVPRAVIVHSYVINCRLPIRCDQVPHDDPVAHRLASEMLKTLEAAFPRGAFIVWRLRPQIQVYEDGALAQLWLRIGCEDHLLPTAQPVLEGMAAPELQS